MQKRENSGKFKGGDSSKGGKVVGGGARGKNRGSAPIIGRQRRGGGRGRPLSSATAARGGRRRAAVPVVAETNRRRGGPPVGARNGGGRRLGVAASRRNGTRRQFSRPQPRFGGQRMAQNLVKRAMLSSRRQAIASRRVDNLSGETQRLAREVTKWRTAAKTLQNALRNQVSRGRNRRVGHIIPRSLNNNNNNGSPLQGRLGWRVNNKSEGQPRRRNLNKNNNNSNTRQIVNGLNNNKKNRPSLGSMQSDLISRQEENEKRIIADVLARLQQQNQNATVKWNTTIQMPNNRSIAFGSERSLAGSRQRNNMNRMPTSSFGQPNRRSLDYYNNFRNNNRLDFGRMASDNYRPMNFNANNSSGGRRFGGGPKNFRGNNRRRNNGVFY